MASRPLEPKVTVARGYDAIAEGYLRWRGDLSREGRDLRYFDSLTEGLPDGSRVLDLGCGAGVPYTAHVSERFATVGVDISRGQLALARRRVAGASFLLADMCSLQFRAGSFDAIAAFYSIIHVPREEHETLFRRIRDWLRPGGRLLVVLGANDWEGTEHDWLGLGAEMWWSHFDAETSRSLVERAGFAVIEANIEPDVGTGEGAHLFVLAEKPS